MRGHYVHSDQAASRLRRPLNAQPDHLGRFADTHKLIIHILIAHRRSTINYEVLQQFMKAVTATLSDTARSRNV